MLVMGKGAAIRIRILLLAVAVTAISAKAGGPSIDQAINN